MDLIFLAHNILIDVPSILEIFSNVAVIKYYRVLIKYSVFFQRIFKILRHHMRKDRSAIGCTENDQPTGVYNQISDQMR